MFIFLLFSSIHVYFGRLDALHSNQNKNKKLKIFKKIPKIKFSGDPNREHLNPLGWRSEPLPQTPLGACMIDKQHLLHLKEKFHFIECASYQGLVAYYEGWMEFLVWDLLCLWILKSFVYII